MLKWQSHIHIDHAYHSEHEMEGSSIRIAQKAPCKFCSKEISKSNLKRHEDNCSGNDQSTGKHFTCHHCHKTFKWSATLKLHLKKCITPPKNVRRKSLLPCNYDKCSQKFDTLNSLIFHLQSFHSAPAHKSQILTFKNEKSFIEWKEEEQARTFSYFSRKCGVHSSGKGVNTMYFYCQQHGSEKRHRKNEETETKRRVGKGRIKTGKVCISSMKVISSKDGSVTVTYQPTHSHPLNASSVKFHPLSAETYKYIDTQLAVGVSPLVIKRELKKRALEKAKGLNFENIDNHKDCSVSLKLIKERARRSQRKKMYNEDDANSVMLLNKHMTNENPEDLILIYKPLEDSKVHSFPRDMLIPQIEITECEIGQPFFSEPILGPSADDNERVARQQSRKILKERIKDNINKILLIMEDEKVPDNVLCKLDAEVDATLKCTEALLEDVDLPASFT